METMIDMLSLLAGNF